MRQKSSINHHQFYQQYLMQKYRTRC